MDRAHAPRPKSVDDHGFTMVELVVSLTVMAVGVLGAMSVFNSSFSVAGQASSRSRAVALATSEIEAVRAVPYGEVTVGGETDVRARLVGGTTFSIERGATSADEGPVAGAYKRVAVVVSWRDHGGEHSVAQSTLLYPGGLGPHVGATSTVPVPGGGAGPAPPQAVTATPATDLADAEPAVDLAWSSVDEFHVAGFSVRYQTGLSQVVVTDSLPPGSRALRVSGLSAATTYTFEVGARSTTGSATVWSAAPPLTTPLAVSAACTIGTPALDPAQVERRSPSQGGTLLVNPTFSVNTSGSCAGLRIAYRPTKHAVIVSKPLAGTTGLRTRSLEDLPTKWDSGTHLIELYDGTDIRRATLKFLVCDRASSCR